MTPTKKQPLFIVTGASCAGKSTMCSQLFLNESEYIVMESDILWNNSYNTPENNYSEYRRMWMRLCANISQIGKPVVLCGCATPEQFENHPERGLFTDIHYLAVVCSDEVICERMKNGRGVTDENWLKSSLDFNKWLTENAEIKGISLLDTSELSPKQAAEKADKWILQHMN